MAEASPLNAWYSTCCPPPASLMTFYCFNLRKEGKKDTRVCSKQRPQSRLSTLMPFPCVAPTQGQEGAWPELLPALCPAPLLKTSYQNVGQPATLPSPGQTHAETRGQRPESRSGAGPSPSEQSERRPSLKPAASSQKQNAGFPRHISYIYNRFSIIGNKNHNFPIGKLFFFNFK